MSQDSDQDRETQNQVRIAAEAVKSLTYQFV